MTPGSDSWGDSSSKPRRRSSRACASRCLWAQMTPVARSRSTRRLRFSTSPPRASRKKRSRSWQACSRTRRSIFVPATRAVSRFSFSAVPKKRSRTSPSSPSATRATPMPRTTTASASILRGAMPMPWPRTAPRRRSIPTCGAPSSASSDACSASTTRMVRLRRWRTSSDSPTTRVRPWRSSSTPAWAARVKCSRWARNPR